MFGFGFIRDFIKYVMGLKGLWTEVKQYASTGGGRNAAELVGYMENNAGRYIDPSRVEAVKQDQNWNAMRNARDYEDAKMKAYSAVKDTGFVNGRSPEEMEEYVKKMGQNTGFLE